MQKIFSLPGCLKELRVTVKWAVHLHAVYTVFQPALPEKSWTQTVTLIEGWWAWMLGYILFIIPWPFVLLGWHWLCKPSSVSKVPRRACYSLKQAVAVPTPQPQDLHRVPHAAEHREHPSHIPVGCWMYSPTSTRPAVLKKEVPESLRDIVFPMSRCLRLSAWPCVFSVECHLESATVLSLPHMPEITQLAAGDTFWAQAGKNFSGKSLESHQVCCIAPVWPCTAPWLDAGSTSGEMEGFPLPSHRSELFLPEQNEGKKHVVLVW